MLQKKSFEDMKGQIESVDKKRDEISDLSREILKRAKQAIYSVHRNEIDAAEKLIGECDKNFKQIEKIIGAERELSTVSLYNAAQQEYGEAVSYYNFIKDKKIPTASQMKIGAENYLCALSDLTGELGRKAVLLSINKQYKDVQEIRDLVEEIYGEMIKFNLKNGELRNKTDAIKWNLQKVENLIYENQKK